MEMGESFFASHEDSAVALDTGATANLVCSRWLAHYNRILERRGIPRMSTYPSKARFRFVDGRLGEVRQAADIPLGIAGAQVKFTALAPDADVPVLLR